MAGLAAVMTAALVIVPSLLLILVGLLIVGFAAVALWQGGTRVRRHFRERGWSLRSWRGGAMPDLRGGLAAPESRRLLLFAAFAALVYAGIFLAFWLTPAGVGRQLLALQLQALGLALLALAGSYLLGRTGRDLIRTRWVERPYAEALGAAAFGVALYLGLLIALSVLGVPGWIVGTLFAGLVGTLSIAAGVSLGIAAAPEVARLARPATPEQPISRETRKTPVAPVVVITHGGETAEGEERRAA
ncbi:MAG: hypothetical protein ACK47B_06040 [Armatimonadota bacterium]